MARKRSFHSNFNGFLVANLTDKNDLRILTQEGAKDRVEGEADLFIRLRLADTFQIIFHRILGGHNVELWIVDMLQTPIQGRGLAGSGRSGHQHHALRCGDCLKNVVVIGLREANAVE